MLTYNHYLEKLDSLTFQEAEKLYSRILKYSNEKDEDFQEFLTDMVTAATDYANKRSEWSVQTIVQRRRADESRTIQHDAFMMTLTKLARYMKNQAWDSEWIAQLGSVEKDRKRLGDFACYMVCINSLNAR